MKLLYFKKIGVMLSAMILLFSFTACSNDLSVGNTSITSNDASSPQVTKSVTITDREGNTIILPDKVEKIISIAPSITETLVHLGLANKLVAVDKYSVDIAGLPENLPAYDMMTPDTESIATLKPDIVFATGMSKANGNDPFKPITDLGILMTYIPSSTSIGSIKEDIRFIGQITGTSDNAEKIINDMEKEIIDIIAKIDSSKQGKTVYFEVASTPKIYSFGKGVFLNEIIEMLGAKNILADQNEWVSVSEEAILEKNPDFIFTNVDYIEKPVDDILYRNGWDVITAVKNKTVYLVDKNASSRPNEYVTVVLMQIAKALYPDSF